jgi:hypothetical protein
MAWDQLDRTQAQRAWESGRLMGRQQAVDAAIAVPNVADLAKERCPQGRATNGQEGN